MSALGWRNSVAQGLAPVLLLIAGCSADETESATNDDVGSGALDDSGEPGDGGPDDVADGSSGPPTDVCEDGLPLRAWEEGETGVVRRALAGDFTIRTVQGREFNLRTDWTGCDSFIFIPDQIPNSQIDPASIWTRDIDALVAASPPNVHYFFVSTLPREASALAAVDSMARRVEQALDTLPREESDYWFERMHVVDTGAAQLPNWLKDTFAGAGREGFAIDRFQRVRGIGSFADVTRYNATLAAQEAWPWESNLANAAREARFFNAEVRREQELAALTDVTEVMIHSGEVIEQFAESDIMLPDAATMATFDGLQIDVTQLCPNNAAPEFGNCGAWDYLAYLFVYDGETRLELARFITTYHREGRFIVDATPMLVHLRDGGMRKFRWEWAPEWNKQPTATRVSLRFLRAGAADRPEELIPLWSGGLFTPDYNERQAPIQAQIPADAKRVELWAIITGHGAEYLNCAEFCDHQHEVRINGDVYLRTHPSVGNDQGCVDEVENGMTPNQWGTWWFGRGGWCPGQQVEPWIEDVTDSVVPGQTADLVYTGLLNGLSPQQNAGNIHMTSYLVVYR